MKNAVTRSEVLAEMVAEEEAAVEGLRVQIREREGFIARLREKLAAIAPSVNQPSSPPRRPASSALPDNDLLSPQTLPERMVAMMRGMPEGVTVSELARRLISAYPEYEAKEIARFKSNILTTIARKTDVYVKLESGLYQLRENVHGETSRNGKASASRFATAAASGPEAAEEEPWRANASAGQRVTVKRGSMVALAVRMISEKGPLPLKDIAMELRALGKGTGTRDFATFTTSVNSALWRRKDVFERKRDGSYHLRAKEVEVVD